MSYIGKILLVEGDRVEQDFLKKTFQDAGFEVSQCETAKRTFESLSKEVPDIVISNILLPDISGWELFREIKKDPKRTKLPFILLGNKEEVGDRIQAYRLGIEDIFYKPLDAEGLVRKVYSILKKVKETEGTYPSIEEGIKGKLKDMGLVDILQVLNMSNKTSLVYLTHNDNEGKVFLKDGNVAHVECGDITGEEALYHLLSWRDGDFHIEPDVSPPYMSIDSSMETLLLEGMKRLDEEARKAKVKGEKRPLSEEDPESYKVIQKLFELGILEKIADSEEV